MAASVGTPTQRSPADTAKDLMEANPIRKPVKLPGPDAAANKSTSSSFAPKLSRAAATVEIKSTECEVSRSLVWSDKRAVPRANATLPARVAVSMARINGAELLVILFKLSFVRFV